MYKRGRDLCNHNFPRKTARFSNEFAKFDCVPHLRDLARFIKLENRDELLNDDWIADVWICVNALCVNCILCM